MLDETGKRPFGEIALCLSGGGFRAATYALGTMALLHEVDLLDDVTLLSTVSGGTFTGIAYASYKAEGKDFETFRNDLSAYLRGTNVIDEALERIYTAPSPSGSTDLSLIRAAAESYREQFIGSRTFGGLLDTVREAGKFRELIFNATEFRGGNGFRFRASRNTAVFIGNQIFAIPQFLAREIRLADIVAASSCFPGAFEPLRFPDDFHWQSDLSKVRAALIEDITNPFADPKVYASGFKSKTDPSRCIPLPLMDGGVFDNQGVAAAVLADRQNNFGLFLITDTSARNEALYETAEPGKREGRMALTHWFWVILGIFLGCLAAAGIAATALFFPESFAGLGLWPKIAVLLIAITPAVAIAGGILTLYRLFRKYKTIEIDGAIFPIWQYIRRLTLADAVRLLIGRAKSVLALTSSVFMKRIRQLQFDNLMSAKPRPEKVAFNLIHSLDRTDDRDWLWKLDPLLIPGAAVRKTTVAAEKVETKLWLSDGQFDDLYNCGRATTCFSLLKFLWKKWKIADVKAKEKNPESSVPKPDSTLSPDFAIYWKLIEKWIEIDPEALARRDQLGQVRPAELSPLNAQSDSELSAGDRGSVIKAEAS